MHITLTVNNSSRNVIIYKNGASILNTTIDASYIEETRDISFIGNNNSNDRGLYGDISDVRIYDQVLTATQVKQIYNNTLLTSNVTLNKDQLIYIIDAVDSNNNGYKNIVYSQNNKVSDYETEIITNEYIDSETNDKISIQLGRIESEKWYHIVLNSTFNNSTSSNSYFGYDSNNYFSGCMDDFRLYNKILTPDEVKHLYNRQLSGGNLALHLPLTENTNNNLKDKSIYKHVTTNHGVESGDIGPVGGSITFNPIGVISFDGTDDNITIPYDSSLDVSSTGGVSVSVWVYVINYTSDFRCIFGAYNNKSGNVSSYRLMINTSGKPYFLAPSNEALSNEVLDLNKWYHIVGTANGSTRKIYVNGFLKDTDTTNVALNGLDTNNDDSIRIGTNYNNEDMFFGSLSDFRIYNQALTAEQIKDIYFNQTILGTEVLHYKFNEKMGTTAFDSSGNGNNGTLTNGPTYYLSNPYRNYAMKFDGSNDVNMDFVPKLNFSRTDSFTINCWLYVDGITGSTHNYNNILGQINSTDSVGWYIQQHLHQFWFTIRAGAASNNYQISVRANGFSFTAKVWTHLSVVFTGTSSTITTSNIKFYINGINYLPTPFSTDTDSIASSYDFEQSQSSNIGKFSIGTRRWGSSSTQGFFHGKISDVRIYDYALDVEEIYKIYKNGEVFGNEIVHYTFNQGGGDQVLDQSGNGIHGITTNEPTYQKVENPNLGSYLTIDSAERFNNSNEYLYPMYDISSKSHSFFCWMKLDENYTSGKNDNCIFSKVLNKNYVDMALSLNNGKLEFETKFNDNIDSSVIELYPTFLPNQWYHIGYSINYTESSTESINTKKTGALRFYINGVMHNKYVSNYKRYTSSKNHIIRTHNINNFHNSKLYIGKEEIHHYLHLMIVLSKDV